MRNYILAIILITFTVSCKKDNINLNGSIDIVEYVDNEEFIAGRKIELKDFYIGDHIVVKDSIMVSWLPNDPFAFYSVYNLTDGSSLGKYCLRGNAENETAATSPVFQIYEEDGDYKALVNFHNDMKVMTWNITESVSKRKTVFDNFFTRQEATVAFNEVFKTYDKSCLCYVLSHPITRIGDEASLPYWIKISSGVQSAKYDIFIGDENISGEPGIVPMPEQYYKSANCISPDGEKLVMAMELMEMIIIVNLKNHKIHGYRISGTPGFELLKKTMYDVKASFLNVQCDDKYIYALYSGEKYAEAWKGAETIYVFNWSGHMVKKVKLDNKVNVISCDEKGSVYALNTENSTVFKYKIN